MATQQNRIREADIQFRSFLRQRLQPIEPSSRPSASHDEASFLHPTSARPADTEAAIREASASQGDPASSTPTVARMEYNPQAQEWDPQSHGEDSSGQQGRGEEGDQGQNFDPEAEAFHPSEERGGKAEGGTEN